MLMARQKTSWIHSLYDRCGQLQSTLWEIHKVAQCFYKGIHNQEEGLDLQESVKRKQCWVFDQVKGMLNPRLIPDLIRPITEEEVSSTIKELKKQRTPSPNGILVEFYASFSDLVVPLLARMYQEGWFIGDQLPPGILLGDITLIPKGGDQERIENKRPITPLNVIYNCFAKVWKICLLKVA